jgi:hypothetical protein
MVVGVFCVTVPTADAVPVLVHEPLEYVSVAPIYGLDVSGNGAPQLPPRTAPPEQFEADDSVTFVALHVPPAAPPLHWQALALQSRESPASPYTV